MQNLYKKSGSSQFGEAYLIDSSIQTFDELYNFHFYNRLPAIIVPEIELSDSNDSKYFQYNQMFQPTNTSQCFLENIFLKK